MYYNMPKFHIYLIWSKDCEGNILKYYGSTTNMIKRKYNHKTDYNRWVKAGRPSITRCSSVHIIDNGDWQMIKIDEVIGERWEARKLESEYQKNNECVNICIASRTAKEYYNDNRAMLSEKRKQYYKDNRNELNKKHKQYYETHKEKITCECGSKIRRDSISRHRKNKKHINLLSNNELNV